MVASGRVIALEPAAGAVSDEVTFQAVALHAWRVRNRRRTASRRHTSGVPSRSRFVSECIDRPAADVYEYASDPANLPEWAPGLGSSVEHVGGQWFVETSDGRVGVAFADRNDYGVLDHDVTLPSGDVISNPMRVVPDDDGCEVVFHLRRLADMSDEDFDRDAGLVQADLTRLKHVLEAA
jgi:Polyketide cyclase / dehydrase and lipid transport